MALDRIKDSLGDLKEDLLQIAIDRFGQEEWDNVISQDKISKQKVESYVKEQMIAIQAFLTRQTFTITEMEAFGEIRKGTIDIEGGGVSGPVSPTGGLLPGAKLGPSLLGLFAYADNRKDIEISVQISEEDPGYGPKVKTQVKRSAVKLKENLGLTK